MKAKLLTILAIIFLSLSFTACNDEEEVLPTEAGTVDSTEPDEDGFK